MINVNTDWSLFLAMQRDSVLQLGRHISSQVGAIHSLKSLLESNTGEHIQHLQYRVEQSLWITAQVLFGIYLKMGIVAIFPTALQLGRQPCD